MCLREDMQKMFPGSTIHNRKNLENTECKSTEKWTIYIHYGVHTHGMVYNRQNN